MFFKILDKFFNNAKQIFSLVSFLLIGLATYFFVYWLLYNANVPLPQFLTSLSWQIIDFFAFAIKNKPIYNEFLPVLPVATCVVFILLTYTLNCLSSFLESNQKLVKEFSNRKRIDLEKKINRQLHKSFIEELNVYKYAMIKIKIVATQQESYLSALNNETIDVYSLSEKIENNILNTFNSNFVAKKGKDDSSLFFIVNDLANLKEVITKLVLVSTENINRELRPKLDVDFYCGIDVATDNYSFPQVASYLNRVVNLKIKNKILVSPKFKIYFENILPDKFNFCMAGVYNLSDDPLLVKESVLYYITRKV